MSASVGLAMSPRSRFPAWQCLLRFPPSRSFLTERRAGLRQPSEMAPLELPELWGSWASPGPGFSQRSKGHPLNSRKDWAFEPRLQGMFDVVLDSEGSASSHGQIPAPAVAQSVYLIVLAYKMGKQWYLAQRAAVKIQVRPLE